MGSISELAASISLQFNGYLAVKHLLESNNTVFYNRHVNDKLIIFDGQKIKKEELLNYLNNINRQLKCQLTQEGNEKIRFVVLLITRNTDKITNDIF
jgi:hypothetical protein